LEALFAACPAMIAAYADFRVVRGGAWLDGTKFEQAPDSFWEGLDEVADVAGGGVFHGPVVARLLSYQPFFPSAMMVRRAEFLAVGGWDEAPGRTLGGDFATALLMAEQPALGVLRRPTVGIRKHRENRSGDVQHMNLGDSLVLEQVLRNRPSLAPYRDAIQASVVQRRLDALHSAFARADYDGVREIAAMIPAAHRSGAVMAKSAVASLPRPARDVTARVLRAAGNVRMRLGGVLR